MGTLLQIPSQVSPGQATPGLMLVGPEGELLLLHQLPSLVCGAHLTKQLLWSGYLGAKESRAGRHQLLVAADCEQGQQGEGRPVQAWQCCWLPAVCRGAAFPRRHRAATAFPPALGIQQTRALANHNKTLQAETNPAGLQRAFCERDKAGLASWCRLPSPTRS